MDITVTFPNGPSITGSCPIVVIGPNGSGKSRAVRTIQVEGDAKTFVNAQRNTRVLHEVQMMAFKSARQNFESQAGQALTAPWEPTNDVDMLLARLYAEDAASMFEFRDAWEADGPPAELPGSTMQRVRELWRRTFPGRDLAWKESAPIVRSSVIGSEPTYSGQFMSDGERAALYLIGRVLVAPPGVLVVDEPETHFHSMVAVELWNVLEDARDDLRIVYVTHDMTFGLSRRNATFVLVNPGVPMRILDAGEMPHEAVATLLGTASFSFHASRVILCEGEATSSDYQLLTAWFEQPNTVVRPMGSCDSVIRATTALRDSRLVVGVEVTGIIDRDFHSDDLLGALPAGVATLPLHEMESLYCLPGVVSAVAQHLGRSDFDVAAYEDRLRSSVTPADMARVLVERWRQRVKRLLLEQVDTIPRRPRDIDEFATAVQGALLPADRGWTPEQILEEERAVVESAVQSGEIGDLLRVMPGKPLIAAAASAVRTTADDLRALVNLAVRGTPGFENLRVEVLAAWQPLLPPRRQDGTAEDVDVVGDL